MNPNEKTAFFSTTYYILSVQREEKLKNHECKLWLISLMAFGTVMGGYVVCFHCPLLTSFFRFSTHLQSASLFQRLMLPLIDFHTLVYVGKTAWRLFWVESTQYLCLIYIIVRLGHFSGLQQDIFRLKYTFTYVSPDGEGRVTDKNRAIFAFNKNE